MDDSSEYEYEPIAPKAAEPPPLKRLWKDPDESEPDIEAIPVSKKKKKRAGEELTAEPKLDKPKKKKKKKDEEVVDDGTGATKLAETPALDTYEARQRARWIIGTIISAIFLFGLVIVLKAFKANGTVEVVDTESTVDLSANTESRSSAEREARIMLDMAKQADKLAKTSLAMEQLNKLIKIYPGTAAAREAMHAVAREKQDKTLFGVDTPEQVSGPKPPAPGIGTARGPAVSRDSVATNTNPSPTRPTSVSASGFVPSSTSSAPPPPPIVFKKLPSGYRPKFDYPIHESGWPSRIVCDRDGAELVLVPAASFLMGRSDGEPEEGPVHEVGVSTYYIDLHEVTLGQYLGYLKESGRLIDASKFAANGNAPADDLPVVNVTSREAKAYCDWMKRRLPTEAQWELAARGPMGLISYWNGDVPRKDPDKGPRPMEPTMSLVSDLSPYGAMDMAANAWEWTSEFYDSRYYTQFRNRVLDPTGPKESPARLARATVKGGSKLGILTWRTGLNIELKLPYVGFRGALPVEGKPVEPVVIPAPGNRNMGPAPAGGVQPF